MKVARLVIYEGTEQAIAEQLGRSLGEGIRKAAGSHQPSITVIRLPDTLFLLIQQAAEALKEDLK